MGQGELNLPAFLDVAGRLQAKLADESVGVREVVEVISSEPEADERIQKLSFGNRSC